MKVSKKNFIKLIALAFLLISTVFYGCKTTDVPVKEPSNYSDNDAVNDEINVVKLISEKEPVKALWRAYLLKDKYEVEPDVKKSVDEFYAEMQKLCFEIYTKNLKEEKYFEALKIARSFEALDLVNSADDSQGFNIDSEGLNKKIADAVPVLKSTSAKESIGKVSDMIKGTVTVYVDKGIKVEHGAGYIDGVIGSGFFITKDGYLITNHHVIADMVDKKYEGFSRLYIKLAEDPDTRIPAKVIGWDSTLDLALLKTEIEAPYVFELGSSADLDVGDKVFAIGSPLGLEKTLTSGIISSTDRRLSTTGHVFQIDAAVNSGNSGGPLIDERGKVQAIVFAGVENYQGLNFAIPVEYLKTELPFLFNGGERNQPWICAYGKTKRKPGSGNANEGVTVNYVMNKGSSMLAGLKENDVIKKIQGQDISSLDDLQFFFMQFEAGTILKVISTDENEKEKTSLVYLETRPEKPGYEVYRSDTIANSLYPLIGFRLVNTSTLSKKKFNIVSVLKGSVADEAGFSENDPVEIYNLEMDSKNDDGIIQLMAKKRKNGYLDVSLMLQVPFDSPYYF